MHGPSGGCASGFAATLAVPATAGGKAVADVLTVGAGGDTRESLVGGGATGEDLWVGRVPAQAKAPSQSDLILPPRSGGEPRGDMQ